MARRGGMVVLIVVVDIREGEEAEAGGVGKMAIVMQDGDGGGPPGV